LLELDDSGLLAGPGPDIADLTPTLSQPTSRVRIEWLTGDAGYGSRRRDLMLTVLGHNIMILLLLELLQQLQVFYRAVLPRCGGC